MEPGRHDARLHARRPALSPTVHADGYGEPFFDALHGGWATADAHDFLEPIDQLVAEGLVDSGKLAVTGYCYGGFMTCYLTATDKRFAAAVPGGIVCDLTSLAGTSDLAHLLSTHSASAAWRPGSCSTPVPATSSRSPVLPSLRIDYGRRLIDWVTRHVAAPAPTETHPQRNA